MLQDGDESLIAEQKVSTLARWWCQLNRFKWPAKIPNEETVEQYADTVRSVKSYNLKTRRGDLMRLIEEKIGLKECLWAWNAKRMSNDEFEEWWSKSMSPIKGGKFVSTRMP